MATFSSHVSDDPMAFPKLKILSELEACNLSSSEAAADEKREQSAISLAAKSVGCLSTE